MERSFSAFLLIVVVSTLVPAEGKAPVPELHVRPGQGHIQPVVPVEQPGIRPADLDRPVGPDADAASKRHLHLHFP